MKRYITLSMLFIALFSCDNVNAPKKEKSFDEHYNEAIQQFKEKKYAELSLQIESLFKLEETKNAPEKKAKVHNLKGWMHYLQGNGLKSDDTYTNAFNEFYTANGLAPNNDSRAGITILGHLLGKYAESVEAGKSFLEISSYQNELNVLDVTLRNIHINAAWSACLLNNFDQAKTFMHKLTNQELSNLNTTQLIGVLKTLK